MPTAKQLKSYPFSNTYGLALCGGQSSRMGTDKSMLHYYDKPQRYHVYDLLLPCCEQLFISCNKDQAKSIEPGYNYIQDTEAFGNIGPMVALLTAFTQYPQKNMLLIGCDYPFLTTSELELFSASCTGNPVAFFNDIENVYEPVLAWYPYASFPILKKMFVAKHFSLQHFLQQNLAAKYFPINKSCIKSIDTGEAFMQTIKLMNG